MGSKYRDIFNGNIGTCLKTQVYNSSVLPATTFGAETWALTTQAKNKLPAAQTKMERSTLNIPYRTEHQKHRLKKQKVTDVIEQVRRRKWTWAGHFSRIRDNADGHCVSPHGNTMKGKHLEEGRQDVGEMN